MRRRLSDFWVVGKEIEIDDGQGEPDKLWLQKLNDLEHQEAVRRANAARATRMSVQRDPESLERKAMLGRSYDMTRDACIDFLIQNERGRLQPIREAEVAGQKEWSDESYLDGLKDSWDAGLGQRYAEEPEDPEAKRVHDELERFAAEATEKVEAELADMRLDLEEQDEDELRDRVVDKLLEDQSNFAWLQEFYRWQLFFAVRDLDEPGRPRYFQSREEVDELTAQTFQFLHLAYQNLEVDVMEGKDSQALQASSPLSEPPAPEEMPTSSGPEVVNG